MSGAPAMVARYRALPASRVRRLALARELAGDPRRLVADVAGARAPARTAAGAFHSAPLSLVRELDEVVRGERAPQASDFAFWLAREGGLTVAGEPLLDCRYVDRELALGGGRRGLRLDLLLVNAHDRTPVLAEVKLGADKDAFAALVQLLACASLLSGRAGYERMRNAYPSAGFARPAAGAEPVVDAMVLLVEPRWRASGWVELLAAAREIARAVTADTQASQCMRRITFATVARRHGQLWLDAERI